jgi:hypothetical protein
VRWFMRHRLTRFNRTGKRANAMPESYILTPVLGALTNHHCDLSKGSGQSQKFGHNDQLLPMPDGMKTL